MDRLSNYKIFRVNKRWVWLYALLLWCGHPFAQSDPRQIISLNENWKTIVSDSSLPTVLHWNTSQSSNNQKQVKIPHNWDAYEGYRRLLHGNRHGDAWYWKTFALRATKKNKRFFLFFEGVGSYATVYVNGQPAGEHAGGRTTFTIDITTFIKTDGSPNQLVVRASHPPNIKDLPWVCGGCSDERGFSEGSQPMGIFRPVSLITTRDLRIEPFGVHAWANIRDNTATLFLKTTVKNYSTQTRRITIVHQLLDAKGKWVGETASPQTLKQGDSITVQQKNIIVKDPALWSIHNPQLYTIVSFVKENNKIIDKTTTDFGFRTMHWNTHTHQFFLNDQPVFINGVAEYEHLMGQSHAFSKEQIVSRMKWLQLAGFNAFRDAHQPHHLLYGQLCNQWGILWWTQFSAHIWYDDPAFRKHFKQLLKEWVIERRNDPSVILWGLQNESKLPEDFAKECTELICRLDPTASSQRLVTTCNGGAGTDWDVPQNWTGTYGGDPNTYASDVKKQVLIGEYGAWRTLDLHTEGGFAQNGPLTEDRITQLMEQKIRLAESVRDSSAGQFFWLLTSHENPGRVQGGEGLRELDRVGPINYKGLLTPWEEPLDVFYMFRSNYAPKETAPMVYIVSHTWPNRWMKPGVKDSLIVYSNCDEVELFNDLHHLSLGKRKRKGIGTHFQWDDVPVQYNVLYAVGYVNGKAVARDTIVLNHLPVAPHFDQLFTKTPSITKPQAGYHYIYRVNCGGPDYRDEHGNIWKADRAIAEQPSLSKIPNSSLNGSAVPDATGSSGVQGFGQRRSASVTGYGDPSTGASSSNTHYWGSSSWTNDFPGMPSFFASQRRTFSPIKGTNDWPLFQTFRYGKDKLRYAFPLPDGDYLVELYFIEPWLGIGLRSTKPGAEKVSLKKNQPAFAKAMAGEGEGINAAKMRLFDIAINDKTILKDLDIWSAAGTNTAWKKTFKTTITGGQLIISFPQSKAGQAIIAAIAIASLKNDIPPAPSPALIRERSNKNGQLSTWLDIGQRVYSDTSITFHSLPPDLYGADWLQFSKKTLSDSTSFILTADADVFVGIQQNTAVPSLLQEYEQTKTIIVTDENNGTTYAVYKKRFSKNTRLVAPSGPHALVLFMPATHMQPAFDLKPVTAYRSNVARIIEGATKENREGREVVAATTEDRVQVEWPIQTGVADMYSITLKYYYPANSTLKGRLQLIGAGESMMLDEPIYFTFTRTGKWNQFRITTSTMINAGNYTIRLIVDKAKGLAISGIDVQ